MALHEDDCLRGAEKHLNKYLRGACAIFCASNQVIGTNIALPRSYEMLARQVRDCCAEDVQLVVEERTLWNQLLASCGRVDRREPIRNTRCKIKRYQVVYSDCMHDIRPLEPQKVGDIISSWYNKRSPPKRAIGNLDPASTAADKRQRSSSHPGNNFAEEELVLSGGLNDNSDVVAEPAAVVEAQPPIDQPPLDASPGETLSPAASAEMDHPASDCSCEQPETPAIHGDVPLPGINRDFFDPAVLLATSWLASWRRMDEECQIRAMTNLFSQLTVDERVRVLAAWSQEKDAFVKALSDMFIGEVKQYAAHVPRTFTEYISRSGAFDELGLGGAAGVDRCASCCPVLFGLLGELTQSEHQRQHGNHKQNAVAAQTLALVDIIGHSRFFGQVAFPTVARTGFLLKWAGTSQEVFTILSRLRMACSESTAVALLNAAARRHVACARNQIRDWRVRRQVPLVVVDNFNPLNWPKHAKVNTPFTRCVKSMTVISKSLKTARLADIPVTVPANAPLQLEACARVLQNYGSWRLPDDLLLPRDEDRHVTAYSFTFLPSLSCSSSTFSEHVRTVTGSLLGAVFECETQEVVVLADPEPLLLFHRQTFVSHHEDHEDQCYKYLKNIIFPIPIFHFRKHGVEAFAHNPVVFTLLIWPYLHSVGFKATNFDASLKSARHILSKKAKLSDVDDITLCDAYLAARDHHSDQMKDIGVNFERLLHASMTISLAYQLVRREWKESPPESSSLHTYLVHCLEELVEIWITPYRDVVELGVSRQAFETLPSQILLFFRYSKPMVARSALFLLSNHLRWLASRRDILVLLAANCKSLNDVHIEHANSILSRSLGTSRARGLTSDRIRRTAVIVQPARNAIRSDKRSMGLSQKARLSEAEAVEAVDSANLQVAITHLRELLSNAAKATRVYTRDHRADGLRLFQEARPKIEKHMQETIKANAECKKVKTKSDLWKFLYAQGMNSLRTLCEGINQTPGRTLVETADKLEEAYECEADIRRDMDLFGICIQPTKDAIVPDHATMLKAGLIEANCELLWKL